MPGNVADMEARAIIALIRKADAGTNILDNPEIREQLTHSDIEGDTVVGRLALFGRPQSKIRRLLASDPEVLGFRCYANVSVASVLRTHGTRAVKGRP